VSDFAGVAANQFILIVEGEANYRTSQQ